MKSVVAVALVIAVAGSAYGQAIPPGYHLEVDRLIWDGRHPAPRFVVEPRRERPETRQSAAEPAIETNPIPDKLKEVYAALDKDVKAADELVKHLKNVASLKPGEMQKEVNTAAVSLARIADLMSARGELSAQVDALRAAAVSHKKRTEGEPELNETDRSAIGGGWQKIIERLDRAKGAMAEMSVRVQTAIQTLRLRQTAISEYILVGQYDAAVNSLNTWLADVQQVIDSLHETVKGAQTV